MPYLSLAVVVFSALVHLLAYEVADFFRPASTDRAQASLARWARWALPWLGIHIDSSGQPSGPRSIYVANHRTYLDILLLAAALDAAFLSRADVASWPVIGAVARMIGTVFVERDTAHGRALALRQLLRRVETANVVVFPEGTTTGARLPLPFHPTVFRVAHDLGFSLIPVTVRYSHRHAYWAEEISMWQHLKRVINGVPLRASVHIGRALRAGDYATAEELRAAVYAAVCEPIERYGELVGSMSADPGAA